ncbi:MAG TPA: CDP-alcohol phosphatidyltransferase family protein [Gemmatimonadales bacterium]|nr:CDP-alcohol phosphatidyltransferase family protein [Gemmatimonadales bacterium]
MNVIPQSVKDGFVRAVAPLARLLIRGQVSPNTLTTVGLLVVLGAATAFALGQVRLGGLLLLVSGLFDILDGQVARQGGRATTFGAFYDSTLDRVGEAALFAGIALFFLRGGVPPERQTLAVGLAIAALTASLLVSYTRARAEGLGLDCKVGLAARAERVLVLGLPALVFGAGPRGVLLFWIVALLGLATAITVVQRVVHVAHIAARAAGRVPRQRDTLPGHAPALRKGH